MREEKEQDARVFPVIQIRAAQMRALDLVKEDRSGLDHSSYR